MKKWLWTLLISILLFPILGIVGGGVIAYIKPKEYLSSTTIQLPTPSEPTLSSEDFSARFVATESAVIISDANLEIVSKTLELPSRWGVPPHQALKRLRKSLSTQVIHGTDLIEVKARALTPEEAMMIAEQAVEAYRDRKQAIQAKRDEQAMAEIRDAVQRQEDEVEQHRRVLLTIRTHHANQDAKSPTQEMEIADAMAEFETAQSLLEQLKLKMTSMRIDQDLGADAVIIHSKPALPHAPVGPNIQLHLFFGILVGILAGLAFPILILPFFLLRSRKARKSAA